VLILSNRLQTVTQGFEELRKVRYEETLNKKLHKRRKGLELLPPPENVPVSVTDNDGYSKDWLKEQEPRLLESRQQLMDQETEALQVHKVLPSKSLYQIIPVLFNYFICRTTPANDS
jgi:hypothetical protein